MNIDKIKKYLEHFAEIRKFELEKIRYFDQELAKQTEYLFSLPHYQYTNEVLCIKRNTDKSYTLYTYMTSMSTELSLEEYINKCLNNNDTKKSRLIIGG